MVGNLKKIDFSAYLVYLAKKFLRRRKRRWKIYRWKTDNGIPLCSCLFDWARPGDFWLRTKYQIWNRCKIQFVPNVEFSKSKFVWSVDRFTKCTRANVFHTHGTIIARWIGDSFEAQCKIREWEHKSICWLDAFAVAWYIYLNQLYLMIRPCGNLVLQKTILNTPISSMTLHWIATLKKNTSDHLLWQ